MRKNERGKVKIEFLRDKNFWYPTGTRKTLKIIFFVRARFSSLKFAAAAQIPNYFRSDDDDDVPGLRTQQFTTRKRKTDSQSKAGMPSNRFGEKYCAKKRFQRRNRGRNAIGVGARNDFRSERITEQLRAVILVVRVNPTNLFFVLYLSGGAVLRLVLPTGGKNKKLTARFGAKKFPEKIVPGF